MVASIDVRFFRGRLSGDYAMMACWTLERQMSEEQTLAVNMFPAAEIPQDMGYMHLKEMFRREGFLGYGLVKPSELIICHFCPTITLPDFVGFLREAFQSSQARRKRISDYLNAEMFLVENGQKRSLGPLFPVPSIAC